MARGRLGRDHTPKKTSESAGTCHRRRDPRQLHRVQKIHKIEQYQQRIRHIRNSERYSRVFQCDARHPITVQVRKATVRGNSTESSREANVENLRGDTLTAIICQIRLNVGVYTTRRAQYTTVVAEHTRFPEIFNQK